MLLWILGSVTDFVQRYPEILAGGKYGKVGS